MVLSLGTRAFHAGAQSLAMQFGRTKTVTAVSFSPVGPSGISFAKAPEIGGLGDGFYGDPRLPLRPMSAGELGAFAGDAVRAALTDGIAAQRDMLARLTGDVLGDAAGEVTADNLAEIVEAAGDRLPAGVGAALRNLEAAGEAVAALGGGGAGAAAMTAEARDALVGRAVRAHVDAEISVELAMAEVEASRGLSVLRLFGGDALAEKMHGLLAQGRKAEILSGRDERIGDMLDDIRHGKLVATLTQETFWAGEAVSVADPNRDSDTAVLVDHATHFAAATAGVWIDFSG